MVVGMAGQQQEEIETIRSRTIEVKLSDADVKRISEKCSYIQQYFRMVAQR